MKVERGDNQYAMRADIYPFEGERRHITVEREREMGAEPFGSKWEPQAGINWSAIGTVGAETARLYANALLEACRVAEEMNAVKDGELTTPGGYMVEYRRGDHRRWERIEEGADVPMHDGWTVAKAQAPGTAEATASGS